MPLKRSAKYQALIDEIDRLKANPTNTKCLSFLDDEKNIISESVKERMIKERTNYINNYIKFNETKSVIGDYVKNTIAYYGSTTTSGWG